MLGKAIEKALAGELAGDFTGRSTAHTIADDENAKVAAGRAGILIGLATLAAIGKHGEDGRGWRFWRRLLHTHQSGCGLWFAMLQRCDICYFSTPDE